MNIKVREIVILRIKYAIYNQYVIYLHMSPKEAINEIKRFDEWLKKRNKELYNGPKGKIMEFIKINRKTNYSFLYQLQFCLRRLECLSSRVFFNQSYWKKVNQSRMI